MPWEDDWYECNIGHALDPDQRMPWDYEYEDDDMRFYDYVQVCENDVYGFDQYLEYCEEVLGEKNLAFDPLFKEMRDCKIDICRQIREIDMNKQ